MKCDELCSHKNHPFLYKLNNVEKVYIRETAHKNIYCENEYIFTKASPLCKLIDALDKHFLDNPTNEYFLRLNKLSPKDACYFLEDGIDEEENMTVNTIGRDIEYLHVGASINKTTEHCITVLLHSDRIYCEIAFDDPDKEQEMSVLLLDYQNINYSTETRCFVKDNKLVAVSQYYCDLKNTYADPQQVCESIQNFFAANKLTELTSYVFDVYLDDKNKVRLIELNPFSHGTDPCLFTWVEIDEFPYKFKYKTNDCDRLINLL